MGGRFSKTTNSMVDDFNSSFFDQRLYKQDILGSIAHVACLKAKYYSLEEGEIIKELKAILQDIEDGKLNLILEQKIFT